MLNLPTFSQISLYVLLCIMGLYCLLVFVWQIKVLKGKAMKNTDGSFDSWHDQKLYYGIAFADVFLSCPANFTGIALVFLFPRWGFYLLALVSFWWVWANLVYTVNSLKFENPRITFSWVIIYPFGIVVGVAYIIWSIVYFDAIYL